MAQFDLRAERAGEFSLSFACCGEAGSVSTTTMTSLVTTCMSQTRVRVWTGKVMDDFADGTSCGLPGGGARMDECRQTAASC